MPDAWDQFPDAGGTAVADPYSAFPDAEPSPIVPGNIDLNNRPIIKSLNGKEISTLRSASFSIDGDKEVLLPLVAENGSGILSNADAIKQYKTTGKHLGIFRSPEEATQYGIYLHKLQNKKFGVEDAKAIPGVNIGPELNADFPVGNLHDPFASFPDVAPTGEKSAATRSFYGLSPTAPTFPVTPDRVGPDPNDPQVPDFPKVVFSGPGIPRPFDQQKGTLEQIAAGIGNAPSDLVNFALSGPGVATAGILPTLSPLIQRLVALGFTVDQAKNAIEAGTTQEMVSALAGAAVTGLGVIKAPSELLGLPKPEAPADVPLAQSDNPAMATFQQEASAAPIPEAPAVPVETQGQNPSFVPSADWQEIPEGTVLPNGGEYRFDQATGKNYAKWSPEALSGMAPETTSPAQDAGQSGVAPQESVPTDPQAQSDISPAGGAIQEPQLSTGIANRVLAAESKAGAIGPIESGEGMSWQEMVDLGREQLNKGANPLEIASRLKRTGRISPTDFAVIRAERERLAVESNKAADIAQADPNNPAARQALVNARAAETSWIREVVQPAKTATSDIFRGMQGEAPIDASTFEGLRRRLVDVTGKEPTPYQSAVMRNRVNKVRTAQGAEKAALGKLSQHVEKEFPNIKTPSLDELRAEMQKMAKELTPCNL